MSVDRNIRQQNRSYRRGLVLGLTMAEIMVLMLFVLLLAVAAAMAKKDAVIRDYFRLRETFAAILSDSRSEVTAADVVKELERQKSEIAELRAQLDGLRQYQEKAKLAQDVFQELRRGGVTSLEKPEGLADLRNRLQIANQAIAIAKKAGANGNSKDIADAMELAQAVREAAKDKDGSAPNAAEITSLLKSAKESDQRYKDLLGQNRNLEAQLTAATGGKGGDLPPCWASPETGKAEYIFDVTITSTGLIVASNASRPEMQHRAEQYNELPISMIQFNSVLSPNEFRGETSAIRHWGDEQDQKCRFRVRLIDATRPDEKAIFKQLMLTTGESFYYWLPQ